MSADNASDVYGLVRCEPAATPQQGVMDSSFVITASELRDRKSRRRRKQILRSRSESIRRLVELGLKAKPK
jgi:hypothetical protein